MNINKLQWGNQIIWNLVFFLIVCNCCVDKTEENIDSKVQSIPLQGISIDSIYYAFRTEINWYRIGENELADLSIKPVSRDRVLEEVWYDEELFLRYILKICTKNPLL